MVRYSSVLQRCAVSRWMTSLLIVLLVLHCPAESSAQSIVEEYRLARSAYLNLTKVDPDVQRPERWEKAADQLTRFVHAHEHPDYTPRALYLLGRLYEYTYRRNPDSNALSRAIYFYGKLSTDYADHQLADDALLYTGDLELGARKDQTTADAAYMAIVRDYPDGDMVAKAKKRLAGRNPQPTPAATAKKKKPGLFGRLWGSSKKPSRSGASSGSATAEEEPLRPLPIVSKFPRRPIIVVDPGHGGEEEGAHGVDGVFEKEVVLQISLMFDELLRKRLKAKTVLTRVRDVTVELSERTAMANESKADLFISIHANASVSKRAKGIETYYLDNTNDKSSLRLAKRENAGYGKDLDDLGFMLSDLIQNAKLDSSVSLAHHMQNALHARIVSVYPDVKDLGVKKAPFYVLVGAHMPCVLVEVSFIDNKIEGRRLITREYQKLVAEALLDGVVSYLKSYWKLESVES